MKEKKGLSLIAILALFLLCTIIGAVFITYIVLNSAYSDSFSLLRQQLSELRDRIENSNSENPESYPTDSSNDEMPSYRDLMTQKFSALYEWTTAESSSHEEVFCNDGEKVGSESRVLSMILTDETKADLAFNHVQATLEIEGFVECGSNNGAHAVNRTFRKNGMLINYFYLLPTVGVPETSLIVNIEYPTN